MRTALIHAALMFMLAPLTLFGWGCGETGSSNKNDNNNHSMPVCGDGVREWPEECDGADLGGATCASLGLGEGELVCSNCTLETSGCHLAFCGDGVCHEGEHSVCPEDCAAVAITTGSHSSCALLVDGSAWCWGINNRGQLGVGLGITIGWIPVRLGYEGFDPGSKALSSGATHACAAALDNSLACWGDNRFYQLGDVAAGERRASPDLVPGLSGVAEHCGGMYSGCALVEDSTVRCWGSNRDWCLGVNPMVEISASPVQVTDLQGVTSIGCGYHHVCAVLETGGIRCWGNNEYGQLGDGQTGVEQSSWVPVLVPGISSASQVAGGFSHACAIVDAGSVLCWGDNRSGCLGNGTNVSSPVPVSVQGIHSAVQVCAGHSFSCAVLSGGKILCWGGGTTGALGQGYMEDSNIPVEVRDISTATQVSCGDAHACAVLASGALRCWGSGTVGQLGNGLDFSVPFPVEPIFE